MNALFSGVLPGGDERSFRASRALAYLIGSATGGALLGSTLGIFGTVVSASISKYLWFLIGAMSVAYSLREWRLLQLPLPQFGRTVPSRWGRSGSKGMLLWGLTNGGAGFVTSVAFPAYYILLLWMIVIANPVSAAVMGLTYGVFRALPVLAMCLPKVVTTTSYDDAVSNVFSLRMPAHRLHAAMLLLIGLGLLGISSAGYLLDIPFLK